MNTADLIGHGYPQTLPEAQKEIARLRGLAREWMAFGGEAVLGQRSVILQELVVAIRRLNVPGVKARNAARILCTMATRLDRFWSRSAIQPHIETLRARDACDFDAETSKTIDVLLVDARKVLRHIGHPNGIELIHGKGWLLRGSAWTALQVLLYGGDA
jgi:hypothetical protein